MLGDVLRKVLGLIACCTLPFQLNESTTIFALSCEFREDRINKNMKLNSAEPRPQVKAGCILLHSPTPEVQIPAVADRRMLLQINFRDNMATAKHRKTHLQNVLCLLLHFLSRDYRRERAFGSQRRMGHRSFSHL